MMASTKSVLEGRHAQSIVKKRRRRRSAGSRKWQACVYVGICSGNNLLALEIQIIGGTPLRV